MTSIIDDFASIHADLTKLEQAKMPEVKPDFSATDTGDVNEARKTYWAMYGYPTGGGVDDIATCMSAVWVNWPDDVEETVGC